MKRYRCKKELQLDTYDEDDFLIIKVGDTYEYSEDCQDLFIANKPAVHLTLVHPNTSQWIEIYPETLENHFELVER